jgi:hypothetical protein
VQKNTDNHILLCSLQDHLGTGMHDLDRRVLAGAKNKFQNNLMFNLIKSFFLKSCFKITIFSLRDDISVGIQRTMPSNLGYFYF